MKEIGKACELKQAWIFTCKDFKMLRKWNKLWVQLALSRKLKYICKQNMLIFDSNLELHLEYRRQSNM